MTKKELFYFVRQIFSISLLVISSGILPISNAQEIITTNSFQWQNSDSSRAETDGSIAVTYCCTPKTGIEVNNEKALLRLPDGLYRVSFVSPVSLEKIQETTLESKSPGNNSEIELPSFVDDIIIKIEKIRTDKKTTIKGTE
jgi:hypothetical protein